MFVERDCVIFSMEIICMRPGVSVSRYNTMKYIAEPEIHMGEF